MIRYCLLLCIIVCATADENLPTVRTSAGLIEGEYIQSTISNQFYYSFRGIPYAEPPVGKLRFQPPVKHRPWTNTLMTKKDGSQCVQASGGSEDCLFLNVYTPTLSANEEDSILLPVMVFIHGGGFFMGSSNSSYHGPQYLIDKNIVLVTINYRLNIFGFLNSMDESSPGNVGLKDQIVALEWVQENIGKFNGDKNKVTIFGGSAGSASVQYLIQSKSTEGLFQRGIMESGSTLNLWTFENNPVDVIRKLGEVLNIDSTNTTEIVNELQTLSSDELFNASRDDRLKHRILRSRFVPSVEYDSPNSLVVENSYSILSNNKVNSKTIMIGHNSKEVLFENDLDLGIFDKYPILLVPEALNIFDSLVTMYRVWIEIHKYYFHNGPASNQTYFMNFASDEVFARGIRKSVEFLRKNNRVYFYVFDYNDKNDTLGAPHSSEIKYLFYSEDENLSEKERNITEKLTTLWTNFAKTGNPTPHEDIVLNNVTWPIVEESETKPLRYLLIKEELKIHENPEQENFEFWERIFSKYGKPPFYIY